MPSLQAAHLRIGGSARIHACLWLLLLVYAREGLTPLPRGRVTSVVMAAVLASQQSFEGRASAFPTLHHVLHPFQQESGQGCMFSLRSYLPLMSISECAVW